jgi:sec-independent protein translocase protein TatA
MINGIGPLELGIVLVIVLLIFGPKRLPGLGRQLGSGMREFKDSITGKSKDEDDRDDDATVADAPSPAPDSRESANAALGRPDSGGETRTETVDGEVVHDRR